MKNNYEVDAFKYLTQCLEKEIQVIAIKSRMRGRYLVGTKVALFSTENVPQLQKLGIIDKDENVVEAFKATEKTEKNILDVLDKAPSLMGHEPGGYCEYVMNNHKTLGNCYSIDIEDREQQAIVTVDKGLFDIFNKCDYADTYGRLNCLFFYAGGFLAGFVLPVNEGTGAGEKHKDDYFIRVYNKNFYANKHADALENVFF